jgi:hypothetical protein
MSGFLRAGRVAVRQPPDGTPLLPALKKYDDHSDQGNRWQTA